MDAIFILLAAIEPQHWLALGLVLLIAEMATGTTYLLWPAVAAGITGLVAFVAPIGWGAELALFAVLVIALTIFARPLLRNRLVKESDNPELNERGTALIGAQGSVSQGFVNGLGMVRINDSVWRAQSVEAIEVGAPVQVLAVDGVTLTVKRAG
jgi:membrane protein implicated in regulation of membrane protease activity